MAWTTKKIILTENYQLLLDNTGNGDAKANSDNFFYVNVGSGEFFLGDDNPGNVEGMRVSAGARFMPVPVGAKLYGRLTHMKSIGGKPWKDHCEIFVCYETN